MGSGCIAYLPDGQRCDAVGVIVDAHRGGLVCEQHATPGAVRRHIRHHAIRHAMGAPDRFLAAALAELPDDWLAAELGCPVGRVWRLRLAGYPRADRWAQDVAAMATALDADAARLDVLLRRLAPGRLPLA